MKKDIVRGRPSVIPREDYPQIIADVLSGKRKPSEIAREYKNANGKPVAQANINRIIEEYRANQKLSKRDTDDISTTIKRIYQQHTELQRELDKYGEVGKIILSDVVSMQSIRLQAYGYTPIIEKMKTKINALLDNDKIVDIIGTGEGSQMHRERQMTAQDFMHLEKGVKTLNLLANMECITQQFPTVAIQNNNTQNNQQNVKVDLDKITEEDMQRAFQVVK